MLEEAILLDITIRQLPTSVNSAYATNRQGKRVKTEAAKNFTELAIECIQLENRGFTIPVDVILEFFLVCYYPEKVDKKKDPLYECDSDNPLKIAKDAVFSASMMDLSVMRQANDSQVWDDYPKKRRGDYQTLKLYPAGYCRIILAHQGHAREILNRMGQAI